MSMPLRHVIASAIALTSAGPIWAQDIAGDDLTLSGEITQNGTGGNHFGAVYSSFSGLMCFGRNCTNSESNGSNTIKLKSTTPAILFEDVSTSSLATRDWRLTASGSEIEETFQILDLGQDWTTLSPATPFTIVGGAPNRAFWLASDGHLGLGTSLPQADLHIMGSNLAKVRMETSLGGLRTWETGVSGAGYRVGDVTAGTTPFVVEGNVPSNTLYLDATGNVGIGTSSPDAPFEVSDDNTFSFFRITATDAPVNQSVDITFTQGPLTTGEMRYNIVDGDGPEMRLNADGDMVLDGTLTTGGPTCDTGCDAVFDAEFPTLSITEHAELMWEKGHLPAVGATLPGQPMNVSEKMGAMLNELEHAHIYIAELEARDRQRAEENARLVQRISRIEAALKVLDNSD